MKYLILLTLLLTGCCQHEPENVFKPVYDKSLRYDLRECISITQLGYIKDQTTFDACKAHMTNPKYKIGQKFKMKDAQVIGTCTFVIKEIVWAHGYIRNKPGYQGDKACTNKGELVTFMEEQFKQETEIK